MMGDIYDEPVLSFCWYIVGLGVNSWGHVVSFSGLVLLTACVRCVRSRISCCHLQSFALFRFRCRCSDRAYYHPCRAKCSFLIHSILLLSVVCISTHSRSVTLT